MSSRNKTIKITTKLLNKFEKKFEKKFNNKHNVTINGDSFKILKKIPDNYVDLIIADPPYNLTKIYNKSTFSKTKIADYEQWLDKWIKETYRVLKPSGTIYVCCDWASSNPVFNVLKKYFYIQNRITWAREKGRGSLKNWKNNIEDIYFATKSKLDYKFNPNSIKIKKKVIAPYRNAEGQPKDWFEENGEKIRLTFHSNIWSDITVPYWSMKENTEHSTQKPEKAIAKLILASSDVGDLILDPFLGSGTTSVVAKKLKRNYIGIELDEGYACISEKRLHDAELEPKIQGYDGKYFEEKK